jgi:hypothetical protein
LAAHASWARTSDRTARTAPAREGLEARIARQYGISHDLPPAEYAIRIESARRAYFAGLARKSARARRQATQAQLAVDRVLAEVEAEAADAELATVADRAA